MSVPRRMVDDLLRICVSSTTEEYASAEEVHGPPGKKLFLKPVPGTSVDATNTDQCAPTSTPLSGIRST
jgi:hypothetical protein